MRIYVLNLDIGMGIGICLYYNVLISIAIVINF